MFSPVPAALASDWESAVAFHGHSCPGLAIGCRIAADARGFLNCTPSTDEELVCVAENDCCAIDGIQIGTGCTLGKGNLLIRMRGKLVFTFFLRRTKQSARFSWNGLLQDLPRDQRIRSFLTNAPETLYTISPAMIGIPSKAVISPSLPCAVCGESVAEGFVRLHKGQYVCFDCQNAQDFFCSETKKEKP